MLRFIYHLLLGCATVVVCARTAPTAKLVNGSYYGLYSPNYDQDFFLGMAYAQAPTGDLRFQVPKSLNMSWEGTRNATEYGPECIGYGSDQWLLGNIVSEDCLTINVIRPSGIDRDASLPVAVWIHGGGYHEGGARDPRYNLSFIINQSEVMGKRMIGVSFNYRLSAWGFLFGQQVLDAGATNLGLRDQRLALHWIQENIAAFGGDPSKVTIWGESAGANSVGTHLVAYGGRDDNLFRAAISQSGAVSGLGSAPTVQTWQPAYDAIVNATNCSNFSDTLACLRTIPTDILSDIFNSSDVAFPFFYPYVDGDFLGATGVTELRKGNFVHVPYLLGTNFDEGTTFVTKTINTTEQFIEDVMSNGVDNATAVILAALYPDIPQIGVPATLHGRPPADRIGKLGYMWKRTAAYRSDLVMNAGRRLTSQTWAVNNLTAYTYHFNVLVNGVPDYRGANHFQEVPFVFYNTKGVGYDTVVAANPFANEPQTFEHLADIMSKMWVSFIVDLDPNESRTTNVTWPRYNTDNPQNIVFDVNVTGNVYLEPDIFRAEGIKYIGDHLETVFKY